MSWVSLRRNLLLQRNCYYNFTLHLLLRRWIGGRFCRNFAITRAAPPLNTPQFYCSEEKGEQRKNKTLQKSANICSSLEVCPFTCKLMNDAFFAPLARSEVSIPLPGAPVCWQICPWIASTHGNSHKQPPAQRHSCARITTQAACNRMENNEGKGRLNS